MDLNKLLIFTKVAELQSFTRAAQELRVEKSTVSSNIAELEERLGIRLLNRTTRTVALTEAGEGYYAYCQKVVQTAVEAEEYVQSLNDEPKGLLRISTPEGLGRILFDDLFNSFMKKYDTIDMEILLSSRSVDVVKERYDMAIRVSRSSLKDSSMVGRMLFSVENGLFVSREYAAAHKNLSEFGQLAEHRFITLYAYQAGDLLPKNLCEDMSKIKNRIVINDIEGSIKAIEAGLGIGILPVGAIKKEVESGEVIRIFPEHELDPIFLYAIYPSRQWVSSKLKVFLDFLFDWAEHQETMNPHVYARQKQSAT